MRHTISCTARNRPGVLAKIAGAFADRDINIHSLAVNEAEGEAVSRITVVIECEHAEIETANCLYKALTCFAGLEGASIIAGSSAPIVLPARADSARMKFLSIAFAASMVEQ